MKLTEIDFQKDDYIRVGRKALGLIADKVAVTRIGNGDHRMVDLERLNDESHGALSLLARDEAWEYVHAAEDVATILEWIGRKVYKRACDPVGFLLNEAMWAKKANKEGEPVDPASYLPKIRQDGHELIFFRADGY